MFSGDLYEVKASAYILPGSSLQVLKVKPKIKVTDVIQSHKIITLLNNLLTYSG